jgi:hypothetical protein
MTAFAVAESVVEQVAFAMWKAEAERAAPNVAKNRTLFGFQEELRETRKKWIWLARAAMPRIEDDTPTVTGRGVEEPAPVTDAQVAAWKFCDGDVPDYDDPLYYVFVSGCEYAVRLLAKTLDVTDYDQCDGTEKFDGDLGGTLLNVVLAAMPKNADGDEMYPNEVRAALAQPTPSDGLLSELVEAAQEYMSQFGQALDCHGIPYGPHQQAADIRLRTALAKVKAGEGDRGL